ncbi:MAG: protein-disulfide reductase DsbD domain-containing protein [Muribaculaceae bacterium]
MKRFTLFCLITLLTVVAAAAQGSNAIRWRMSVKMTSDTEGVITLRAVVQQGWHLYSTQLPANGPKPTKFDFSQSVGIKTVGKLTPSRSPLTVHDEMFDMDLKWWDSNVEFTQKFKIVNRTGAKVVASVNFMGCNNETCMPPKTETLTYIFK